jgi:hypothetical protein
MSRIEAQKTKAVREGSVHRPTILYRQSTIQGGKVKEGLAGPTITSRTVLVEQLFDYGMNISARREEATWQDAHSDGSLVLATKELQ